MKRGKVLGIFIAFLSITLLLNIVLAEEIPGLPSGLQPDDLGKVPDAIEKYKNITEWELIGTRFKGSLLEMPVIVSMDNFMTNFTWLFRILFGMHYSLSITLLFVIVLWLFFIFDFAPLLKNYSLLSESTSYGMSIGFAIILAQVKIFESIVNFFGTVIFSREAWITRAIVFFIFLGILTLMHYVSKIVSANLKKQKEEEEKQEARYAGKRLKATAEGIEEGRKLSE